MPKTFRQRPLLTFSQIVVLLGVIAALIITFDLNRRAQAGRLVGIGEESIQSQITLEQTRQVQLLVTATYVHSPAYVEQYARNEAGYLKDGEVRIVPLFVEATPMPTLAPAPTLDPALNARPWQAWWQLLTDAQLPSR